MSYLVSTWDWLLTENKLNRKLLTEDVVLCVSDLKYFSTQALPKRRMSLGRHSADTQINDTG